MVRPNEGAETSSSLASMRISGLVGSLLECGGSTGPADCIMVALMAAFYARRVSVDGIELELW